MSDILTCGDAITDQVNQWLIDLGFSLLCKVQFEQLKTEKNLLISKSHTDNIELYIYVIDNSSQQITNIGIDIENINRNISNKLYKRITTKQERELYTEQDILKLWTAKEALFKANSQNNNTVISQYELINEQEAKLLGQQVNQAKYYYTHIYIEEYIISVAVEANIC